jgi:hypothetical protein
MLKFSRWNLGYMSDLTRIYQGNFFSEYSQLHLRDAASDEGVEWGRDAEEVVFGEHTAMFTVRNDANIEVNIFRGEGKPGGRLAGTGRIMVGAAGLSIGNLFTDTDLIDWPPGETEVTIYLHSSQP